LMTNFRVVQATTHAAIARRSVRGGLPSS
jgi:hypothetical protein